MPSYDFRLFNNAGAPILLYQAVCADDGAALQRLKQLQAIAFARLEVWRGEVLILERAGPDPEFAAGTR